MRTSLILFFVFIFFANHAQKNNFTFSGKVKDVQTGAALEGTTILFSGYNFVAFADSLGDFSIQIPARTYQITVRRLGYKFKTAKIILNGPVKVDFALEPTEKLLEEVVISSEKSETQIRRPLSGVERMSSKTLKKMPTLLGEVDVVRSILALPGVSTIGEGASGFNVRGGNVDQNLVLLDGVPLYNTSHLFGFFTAFNSQVVSDLSLYKGGISSNYGGRSSSVLDVRLKEGSLEKWNFQTGIGPLSSNIVLDGPLIKNKTSILLGARASLSDFYLSYFPNPVIAKSRANFFDLNLKISHHFNSKNKLSVSYYQTGDAFKFGTDTSYFWNTRAVSLQFNSLLNSKWSNNLLAFHNNYSYGIEGKKSGLEFIWNPNLIQNSIKDEISFEPDEKKSFVGGFELNLYKNKQGDFLPNSGNSIIQAFYMPVENAKELSLFLNGTFQVNSKISMQAGIRYAMYGLYGEAVKLKYKEGFPRSASSVLDTLKFEAGDLIKSYSGLEPRLSFVYQLGKLQSFKMGYHRMQQFVHLLSNTMAISPVDIWKFSDQYVKPQVVDQVSAGWFSNYELEEKGSFETSLEFYYKKYNQVVDYVDAANLYLNPTVETDLLNATGRSYGAELMLKKSRGLRTTGWVSYTYSRSFRQALPTSDQIGANFGQEFPANFDMPHSLKIVLNHRLSNRFSFQANFNYSSGRPITYPNGRYKLYAFSEIYDYGYNQGLFPRSGLGTRSYVYNGQTFTFLEPNTIAPLLDGYSSPSFTLRNQERIPYLMRLDVGITIDAKRNAKYEQSWNFSIYNLLSRANVYSVFFRSSTGKINQAKAYELSVLAAAIPSLTYQLKF